MNGFRSFLQTCYGTNAPVWEDAFTFFIQDPRKQDIDIQVSHYQQRLNTPVILLPGCPKLIHALNTL